MSPPSPNAGPGPGVKLLQAVLLWLQAIRPARTRINARERWRIVAGSFVGILLTGVSATWLAARR